LGRKSGRCPVDPAEIGAKVWDAEGGSRADSAIKPHILSGSVVAQDWVER